jgi:hypothetical protein
MRQINLIRIDGRCASSPLTNNWQIRQNSEWNETLHLIHLPQMMSACITETPPIPVRNRSAAKASKLGAKHEPMPNEAIHVPRTTTDVRRPILEKLLFRLSTNDFSNNLECTYKSGRGPRKKAPSNTPNMVINEPNVTFHDSSHTRRYYTIKSNSFVWKKIL